MHLNSMHLHLGGVYLMRAPVYSLRAPGDLNEGPLTRGVLNEAISVLIESPGGLLLSTPLDHSVSNL